MNPAPALSVIVCSHNPRPDYLDLVLGALKAQSLPRDEWELLLIDNASATPLSGTVDLSWHPGSRHIRENELGLTPARLRGIREARADVLLFVDDDNVLAPNYVEQTIRIAREWPRIGAWSGRILPRFEVEPAEWTKAFWNLLAIHDLESDRWSNLPGQEVTTPCGAGLCVRKSVGEAYLKRASGNPLRMALDRKGTLLTSAGDSDLAYTACDVGFGTGRFVDLELTHLIPASRVTEEYLLALVEGINYSHGILTFIRKGKIEPPGKALVHRLKHLKHLWSLDARGRRFYRAATRGQLRAARDAGNGPRSQSS